MGINDPNNLYKGIQYELLKQFMQTFKLSTGDKTPPVLDVNMEKRLEGSNTRVVFVFFLEVVWCIQQFMSGIFGIYGVARAVSVYEKVYHKLEPIMYQTKARFNEENF